MSDSRTRIWFSLFVLAVFGVGLAAGIPLGRRMGPLPPFPGPRFARGGPMGPGGSGPPSEMLIDRLQRDLQLTPDQKTRVEAIFADRRQRLEQVQNDLVARAEQEQRELQGEIRKVLTPDQQQRFDQWLAEAHRSRRGRGPGRGGLMGPFR